MSKNCTSYSDPFGILPNLWEIDSDSSLTGDKKKKGENNNVQPSANVFTSSCPLQPVASDAEDEFEFDNEFDEKFEKLLEDVCLTYGKSEKPTTRSYQSHSQPHSLHEYQDGKSGWAKPTGKIQVWPGSDLDPETKSDYWVPVTTYEGKPVYWTIRRPQTPPSAPYVPEGGYQYLTPPRSTNSYQRSNLSPYAKPFQPRTPQK